MGVCLSLLLSETKFPKFLQVSESSSVIQKFEKVVEINKSFLSI